MAVNLEKLHPHVREKVKQLEVNVAKVLTNSEYEMRIICGFRSYAEQNELHAQGRTKKFDANGKRLYIVTNAKGGQSMHNHGLAVDFCLIKNGKVAVWDTKSDFDNDGKADWMEVVEEAKKLGFSWGGDWKGFYDAPHLEMTGGLTLAQLQAGRKPVFKDAQEDSGASKEVIGKPTIKPTAPVKPTPVKSVSLPTGTYKQGHTGNKDEIKQIQEGLNKLKFNCGKVDGYYGSKVKDAIKRFQSVYLPREMDGIYGSNTRNEMIKQLNKLNK